MCRTRRRLRRRAVAGGLLASLIATSVPGCVREALLVIGHAVGAKPVAIAVVTDDPLAAANPFSAYADLRHALALELGRPVAVDFCLPFQAAPYLESGLYQFALATPSQFSRLSAAAAPRVLAASADAAGNPTRSALLLVRGDAGLQSVADLRGRPIALGKVGDCRTHHAAVCLLGAQGVVQEPGPLALLTPGHSLTHVDDPSAALRDLLSRKFDAAFVDAKFWATLPTDAADQRISQSQFRILGRTAALPDALLLASPRADEATLRRVRDFMLAAHQRNAKVLDALQIERWIEPPESLITTCRETVRAADRGLAPPGEPSAP
ncbi:MAG: hypothetical protein CHACPFDD_01760 [Phycisphaerae bacterium]|nr:hypothetical protein [Phycisphaerae bacterium]